MVPCILLISPEPWTGHFVSKHHYALTLASRGYRVYFLDPPDGTLSDTEVRPTDYPNLWSVAGPQVAKGLRFYPAALRRRLEARWLAKLEKRTGTRFSTVWLFENSRFYDMGFAGTRTKIYHQVDLNQDFHVADAAASADVCFCTTDFIAQRLTPYSERVYKIHHGVSVPSPTVMLTQTQQGRFAEHAVNAVYVGNLDIPYLDTRLLGELVKTFPRVRFHFVGNFRESGRLYALCRQCENVTWWGAVPSGLIPAILSRCDIQLLTYGVDSDWEKAQMASPHKVMEYLSGGKVIVATYTDEYKDKPGLLEMADTPDDFRQKFKAVVSNLEHYNSITKQKERTAFAQDNTYPKQLDRIITILNKLDIRM